MKDDIINNFNEYISKYVKSDRVNHAYLIETNYSDRVKLATILAQRIDSFDSNLSIEEYEKMDDLSIIDPDENVIKTEDIENLKEKFMTKSLTGNKRIYIINNADKMNMYAANKLLKFLEEPEDDIVSILITENKNNVIETIISRCFNLRFFVNDNNSSYDEEYVDKLFDFIMNIEENQEKAIAFQNRIYINDLSDRVYLKNFLNDLLLIYDDVIHFKIRNTINYFENQKENIKTISDKNDINAINRKIKALNECIEKTKFNPNVKLLIDKLIILMSGVDIDA
jgi:DNA polymerase III gamma/tau subunit